MSLEQTYFANFESTTSQLGQYFTILGLNLSKLKSCFKERQSVELLRLQYSSTSTNNSHSSSLVIDEYKEAQSNNIFGSIEGKLREDFPYLDFLLNIPNPTLVKDILEKCSLNGTLEMEAILEEINAAFTSMDSLIAELCALERTIHTKLASIPADRLASHGKSDPRSFSLDLLGSFVRDQSAMFKTCVYMKKKLTRQFINVLENKPEKADHVQGGGGLTISRNNSDQRSFDQALEAIEAKLRVSDFDYIDFRQQQNVKERLNLAARSLS